MKTAISLLFLGCFLFLPSYAFKKKKLPTSLILTSFDPLVKDGFDVKIQEDRYFKKGEKIYFLIQNPNGFASDYIKYQIIKQDDNAHIGGYSRFLNKTAKLKNKNYFSDYFVLYQKGKYYLQVFDITDTNHWLNLEGFMVID